MVNKENEKIILEEVLIKMGIYCENFYRNMYNCYAFGKGHNISKYKKKTEYRLISNIKKIEKILETESGKQIEQALLEIYNKIEKKKKEFFRKKDWVQAFIIIYSCFLQQSYIKEIIEQINKGRMDKELILKNFFIDLSDFRWDFEKILGRNFPNAEFICLENSITKKIKKKKKNERS